VIADFLWILFSVAVLIQSWRLDIGDLQSPGVGFLPFYAAFLLMIFSIISLIKSCKEIEAPIKEILISKKTIILVTILLIYAAILTTSGFLLGTGLLLIILFRIVEPLNWKIWVFGPIFTLAVVYILFVILLGNPLPKGPWGF
jgi:putative tricarboxylic transport membrane protein